MLLTSILSTKKFNHKELHLCVSKDIYHGRLCALVSMAVASAVAAVSQYFALIAVLVHAAANYLTLHANTATQSAHCLPRLLFRSECRAIVWATIRF